MLDRLPDAFFARISSRAARIPFRLLLALLLLSCNRPSGSAPEPAAGPHILKPGKYWLARGKVIDTDTMPPPKYFASRGKYVPGGAPVYFPQTPNRIPVTPGYYAPARSKAAKIDSVTRPGYQPAQGRKAPSHWPQWIPAGPLRQAAGNLDISYLDRDQGLNNSFVRCLLKDRFGRLWMGSWQGGINVWDGTGLRQFTTEEGLSDNVIRCLMESRDGRIWIGTGNGGLSVWDGAGFTHFTTAEGLSDNHVKALLEDRHGNIWIGTGKGLCVWDGAGFTYYAASQGLSNDNVNCLTERPNGEIWIGTGGGVNIWDGQGFATFTASEGLCSNNIRSMLVTGDGKIWIGTQRDGACVWDETGFTHYNSENGLNGNQVWSLAEGRDGAIYLGVVGGGLNVWDGEKFFHLTTENGLSHDQVACALETGNGKVNIGTNGGGLNIWDRNGPAHFTTEEGLGNKDTWSLLEGSDGRIFIGTYGGGLNIWDGNGFFRYTREEGLCGNSVFSLIESRDGKIWIGTYGGGLCSWDGTGFTHYTTDEGLSHNFVYCLLESRDGRIWAGTSAGGLNVWDGQGFAHYNIDQGLSDSRVWSLAEDRQGRIWAGTGKGGISVWDGKKFTHYATGQGQSPQEVWSLLESRDGKIWIGTNGGGLSVWDGEGFTRYTTREGLSSNNIWGLMQDSRGDIWAGTMSGLNRLQFPAGEGPVNLKTFQAADGLRDIMIKPMLEDSEGALWLGTTQGLSRLNPDAISRDTSCPAVMLDGLYPFLSYIDWREAQREISNGENPLAGEQQLQLSEVSFDSVKAFANLPVRPVFPHYFNQLSFTWKGIHWAAPHHLHYSWILEGRDAYWSPPIKENEVYLQHLAPGAYTLKVKAVGGNGMWSRPASYSFTIRPPWWRTWWAYGLYAAAISAALYFLYRFLLQRQLAIAEARRLRELDALKTRLYTNITHDFRSPLTIILGMAEQVAQNPGQWLREGTQAIRRNGEYLLTLVNQMLSLRKLELGITKPEMAQGDIAAYLKYILEAFHSYAGAKNISLHFRAGPPELIMDYDPEKLMQIMSNLLSNAIKFTPEAGEINVVLEEQEGQACISVQDTGIGIARDRLPHIFERFYRAPPSLLEGREFTRGAGIGLALTRELIRLLGGSISVKSQVGKGTEFTVCFPITRQAASEKERISSAMTKQATGYLPALDPETETSAGAEASARLPLALIVEDNPDVTRYLRTCLQEGYRLETAANGQAGIGKALEAVPDIIVSDVVMPEKDGFELTRALKADARTSHIPIILLTAKADVESRIEGLEQGADAYLPKPFNKKELLVRMKKLLELRQSLRRHYLALAAGASSGASGQEKPGISDAEKTFLDKARSVIEAYLDDHTLNVDRLCLELAMSHSQLHRKLTALTGYSPNRFIRYVRLSKAKTLLSQTDTPVNLIAYDTGFSDPDYFSRAFRKEFGKTPTEFRKGSI